MTLIDVLSRPPRLPRAVGRPRLRHVLLDGPEPARLVVAPPGSGKTVAAAQLLDARPGARSGWCRLTPGASGGADLVQLVASALGVAVDEPGAGPLERAAVLLDVLGEQPTTLVIDDYDLGRPEECDAVLAEVLALVPGDCRIVVCSAGRPAGLVGRASVGYCRLIGTSDLAFTTSEVAELLVLLGQDPATAPQLREASAGWPTAVAVLAEAAVAGPGGLDTAVEVLLDQCGLPDLAGGAALAPPGPSGPANGRTLDPRQAEVLAVLSMVPSIGSGELAALNLEPELLGRLATQTALLRPVGDRWGLLDVAREPLRRRLGADSQRSIASRVAPVVAETDPVTAVGILLDAEDDAAAGDLLARHATAVSPDAALPLLYRMRPEVRRRLPPSLSAARATVEMDSALAEAEHRLATAHHPRERVEAQVAVGAILVHRGQLASACTMLEAALRAPRFTAVQAAAAAVGWLGLARLWAGDIDGAAATVTAGFDHRPELHDPWEPRPATDPAAPGASGPSGPPGRRGLRGGSPAGLPGALDPSLAGGLASGPALPVDPSPLARWVEAEVALAQGDLETVAQAAQNLRGAGWVCAAEATTARHALAQGAEAAAAAAAARAYQSATVHGGFDLLVAAPVHAWCLTRAGRWDEATVVAEVLRRRLGTIDTCARLHADLIAEACARAQAGRAPSAQGDESMTVARYTRAIAATRKLGYALVEATARRFLPGDGSIPADGGVGLEVGVLGPIVVRVDGRSVDDGTWRSRKAREVLVVMALAGDAGLSRDEVIEAVWPDRDPERGRSLLRTALAEVRRVLEPARPPGEPSRFVVTRGDRVVVAAHTDLAAVERLWAAARARGGALPAGEGGPPGDPLTAAWRLFRGAPAADEPYTPSLDALRATVERLQLDVADGLVAVVAALAPPEVTSETAEVMVAAAEHVLAVEPWRTEVAERVAASCRAAGHDVAAARAERLLGGSERPH